MSCRPRPENPEPPAIPVPPRFTEALGRQGLSRACRGADPGPATSRLARDRLHPGYIPATPRLRPGYARLDVSSILISAPISPPKSLLFICPAILLALHLPNAPPGVFLLGGGYLPITPLYAYVTAPPPHPFGDWRHFTSSCFFVCGYAARIYAVPWRIGGPENPSAPPLASTAYKLYHAPDLCPAQATFCRASNNPRR